MSIWRSGKVATWDNLSRGPALRISVSSPTGQSPESKKELRVYTYEYHVCWSDPTINTKILRQSCQLPERLNWLVETMRDFNITRRLEAWTRTTVGKPGVGFGGQVRGGENELQEELYSRRLTVCRHPFYFYFLRDKNPDNVKSQHLAQLQNFYSAADSVEGK